MPIYFRFRLFSLLLLGFALTACTKDSSAPDVDLTPSLVGTYEVSQWVQVDGTPLPSILRPSGTSSVVVSRVSNPSIELKQTTDMQVTSTINGATVTTLGKDQSTTSVTLTKTASGAIGIVGNRYSYRDGELYYLVCTVPLSGSGSNSVEVYALSRKR